MVIEDKKKKTNYRAVNLRTDIHATKHGVGISITTTNTLFIFSHHYVFELILGVHEMASRMLLGLYTETMVHHANEVL